MDRKVIFLDIDGTLTEPGKNIPPASALTAIKKAQDKGHLIFLCTGRNLEMIRPLLSYDFDGVVGSSGGYISYKDQIVYDRPMEKEESDRISEVLLRNHIFRTVECKEGSFTDEGFKEYLLANADKPGNSELLRWREAIESSLSIKPMAEYKEEPIYKMCFMCTDEKDLEEPVALLSEDFLVCVQDDRQNGIINGEILTRRYDKGQAVKKVCDYLNIPVSDSIGFGDSMNDREMMEVVGLSVCMANCSETLKKMSDMICPAVTEDGLYKAFEKLGLI